MWQYVYGSVVAFVGLTLLSALILVLDGALLEGLDAGAR